MADFDGDANPFNERGKKDEATGGEDETIPLIPGGGDTRVHPYGDQSGEHETSFVVQSQRERLKEERVRGLYNILSEHLGQKPEVLHYDLFDLKGKTLYYVGPDRDLEKKMLTSMGRLRTVGALQRILGKEGLREMGFDIPKGVSPRKALILNKTEEELPSASAINRASDIELQELTERPITAIKDLLQEISSDQGTQTGEDDPDMPTMRELVGLDKQLRSIRGSLKVEAAKKVELEQHIKREKTKLSRIANDPEYDDGIRDDIRNRIERLNEDLKVREESIDVLKGRLKNQITSFRETIAKVLDKDATLGERIRTLF